MKNFANLAPQIREQNTMTRPTVALIYDFDGTLSPANMQEFGLIQTFGKDPALFWSRSNQLSQDNDASEILCYMKTMIDEARAEFPPFRLYGETLPRGQGMVRENQ